MHVSLSCYSSTWLVILFPFWDVQTSLCAYFWFGLLFYLCPNADTIPDQQEAQRRGRGRGRRKSADVARVSGSSWARAGVVCLMHILGLAYYGVSLHVLLLKLYDSCDVTLDVHIILDLAILHFDMLHFCNVSFIVFILYDDVFLLITANIDDYFFVLYWILVPPVCALMIMTCRALHWAWGVTEILFDVHKTQRICTTGEHPGFYSETFSPMLHTRTYVCICVCVSMYVYVYEINGYPHHEEQLMTFKMYTLH